VTIASSVRQLLDNLRTDALVTLCAMTRSDRRISMRLMAVLAGACALALTAC